MNNILGYSELNNRTVTCNYCGQTDLPKSVTTIVTQHETRDMPLFYCNDCDGNLIDEIMYDEVVDVFDTHGHYCKEVEVHGFNVKTGEYTHSAIGMETCGELEIDEDTIERI